MNKKIIFIFFLLIFSVSIADAEKSNILDALKKKAADELKQQQMKEPSSSPVIENGESLPAENISEVTPSTVPSVDEEGLWEKKLEAGIQADKTKVRLNEESNRFRLIACGIISLVAMFTIVIVLRHVTKVKHTATNIIHISGLILIVFGTIILVIVADGSDQLTAPIGVLGAIAGYLFGKMDSLPPGSPEEHPAGR